MAHEDFQKLINQIMTKADKSHMRPVIEKELLHYDILYALEKENLLDQVTFQGGTSLRLCYGSPRFSEDLDFAGGYLFSNNQFILMKECIEDYIGNRYHLNVSVKSPNIAKDIPDAHQSKVDRWQIAVVTAPEKKRFS